MPCTTLGTPDAGVTLVMVPAAGSKTKPSLLEKSLLNAQPTTSPWLLMPRASVLSHPGQEKKLYVPPERMNPCSRPLTADAEIPTTTPALLIAKPVTVQPQDAGGDGSGVNLPLGDRRFSRDDYLCPDERGGNQRTHELPLH